MLNLSLRTSLAREVGRLPFLFPKAVMKAQSQRRLRQIHYWLGLFFAPAILFFALSGSLQALGFQDRNPGYRPPAWISLVANVHKHGTVRFPAKRPAATPEKSAKTGPRTEARPALPNLFSVFAALLGLLLATATTLGIWIGLLNQRERGTTMLLLAAGCAVPLLLLAV